MAQHSAPQGRAAGTWGHVGARGPGETSRRVPGADAGSARGAAGTGAGTLAGPWLGLARTWCGRHGGEGVWGTGGRDGTAAVGSARGRQAPLGWSQPLWGQAAGMGTLEPVLEAGRQQRAPARTAPKAPEPSGAPKPAASTPMEGPRSPQARARSPAPCGRGWHSRDGAREGERQRQRCPKELGAVPEGAKHRVLLRRCPRPATHIPQRGCRPGWLGLRATWPGGRGPCPRQGAGAGSSGRALPTKPLCDSLSPRSCARGWAPRLAEPARG